MIVHLTLPPLPGLRDWLPRALVSHAAECISVRFHLACARALLVLQCLQAMPLCRVNGGLMPI